MHHQRRKFRMKALWAVALLLTMLATLHAQPTVIAGAVTRPVDTLLIPGRNVGAATRPATAPSPRVQALIDQLDEDSFPRREAAATALANLDPADAPQLRAALNQKHIADAFIRLQQAIDQLEQRTEIIANTDASVITLHGNDAPLREILRQFATQSGTDIAVWGEDAVNKVNSSTITIDLDHASFWDALRQITKSVNLPIGIQGNRIMLGAAPATANQPGVTAMLTGDVAGTVAGPLLLGPTECIVSRSIVYGSPRPAGTVQVQVVILCEPKVTITSAVTCSLSQITDDHDHLLPPSTASVGLSQINGASYRTCSFAFREVTGMGQRLKSIKGNFRFSAQTRSRMIEVKDLPNAAGQSRDLGGGATLEIRTVTNTNGQFRAVLAITGPPTTNGMAYANNPFATLQFFDDSGRLVASQSNSSVVQSSTGATATWILTPLFPQGAGTPTSLRLEVPTASAPIEVPFELHDLAIPILNGQ